MAGAAPPSGRANRRNGGTTKRVKGLDGEMPLTVPRDRDGSFEPELVKKGQTRIDGVDDKSEPLFAIEAPLMGWMAPAPGVAMRHYGVVV